MKKINIFALIMMYAFLICLQVDTLGRDKGNKNSLRSSLSKTAADPAQNVMNINNITSWVGSDGLHDWVVASSWNGAFPKGASVGAIFAEGIVWGGKVNDGSSPTIRVNGNTYATGCNALTRIFRVRPDYATGDLSSDAASYFDKALGAVTDGDIQQIRDQYAKDWQEWPANEGALYKDVDGNGSYDPDVDIPGIPGASQTIFIKYDDSKSSALYGSPAIGLEVSETYWAYAYSGALGNVIYKKVDMIYKGLPSSAANSRIDSMYIVQWSDPDDGNAGDDYGGCDTTLNLGYVYNSGPVDATYEGIGYPPPAAGYDFLQGVSKYTGNPSDSAIFNLKWRKGYKYVNPKPMSSFEYFAAGGTWSDPGFDYDGTLEFYNLMRGRLPIPRYPSGSPFPTEIATVTAFGTYLADGDPVTGEGKLDGSVDTPGDRRLMVTNGPITLNLGDTAQVVLALVGAFGSDYLNSVSVLKEYDKTAQIVFDQLFQLPAIDPPKVKIAALHNEIVLSWGDDFESVDNIENFSDQGYDFEGYLVYQLPTASSSVDDGILLANFDLMNGITGIYDTLTDKYGQSIPDLVIQGTDNGIKRYVDITEDAARKTDLRDGQTYYYTVVSYAYNPSPLLPFHALKSSAITLSITPKSDTPGDIINAETGEGLETEHATGTANASVVVNVVDPTKLTGNDYEVYFDQKYYYLDKDGKWKQTNYPDSVGKNLGKPGDLTGSTLDPMPAIYAPGNTLDIHFSLDISAAPDYDYSDGVSITFPDNVHINSAYDVVGNTYGTTFHGVIDGQTVTWGSQDTTGDGEFSGGEDFAVNVNYINPTFSVDYLIFDDGWATSYASVDSQYVKLGNGIVHVSGTATLTGEVGYQFRTESHWNVKNVTTGKDVLNNQRVLSGVNTVTGGDEGIYSAQIFDGLQAQVLGSYSQPIEFLRVSLTSPSGLSSLRTNNSASATRIVLGNYNYFSGINTSWANEDFGVGTTSIDELQQDYEIRFTGVYDEGTTNASGQTVYSVISGGSMATCFRMSSAAALATNPLNPSPGTAAPFLIRIPFEVWNVDDPNNPYQVNLTYRDRLRDGTENPFYAWNPSDRMYAVVVNSPYNPDQVIQVDDGEDEFNANATWTWVFWGTNYHLGDVVKVTYANPIQLGKDTWTFTAPKGVQFDATQAKQDVKKVNVFPNPYYGTQYRETSRSNHYVTFNHLPSKATIRVFDLSGVLVKTINHESTSGQFDTWNLQNESGYPVASGIYIVYVDMPDLGATKILKLAVVQEEQILKIY